MKLAKDIALKGIENQEGGPFGAVIIDKSGNIISVGNNQVLKNNDPTAHAEIIAIREAAKKITVMTYQILFYILLVNHVQCVYQL